jgi:hypothetical protein
MLTPLQPIRLPDTRGEPEEEAFLTLGKSGLSHGLLLVGAPGSGKTTYQALLALQLLRRGYPTICLDPTGSLSEALIFLLLRYLRQVPAEKRAAYWQKLRVIDVGSQEVVTSFPIFYRRGAETLREQAERFIETLRLAHPNLVKQASVTWPALRRVGINAGMVLASLGYAGLTEIESLLFQTLEEWQKAGRFDEAIRRNPEAAPAVAYFREQYLPLSRSAKSQLTSSLLDHVFTLSHDPKLKMLFGSASAPGLNLEDVEQGQTVLLTFQNVTDPEARRFTLLWIFLYLLEHIKRRGRRPTPLAVLIDECADLVEPVTAGVNLLSTRFDSLIQQYCRSNQVFLSLAFQSLNQLDQSLRNTVLSLGTIVAGRISTIDEARTLADVLFRKDVFRVKQFRNVWGKEEPLPFFARIPERYMAAKRQNPTHPYYVLEEVPQHMSLSDQLELAGLRLTYLDRLRFLCRPALREGAVSQAVFPISIDSLVRDTETGEYCFPDQELVDRVRSRLAARGGIPAATILREQEERLAKDTSQKPPQVKGRRPLPPAEAPAAEATEASLPDVPVPPGRREVPDGTSRRTNGAYPEPYIVRETPSRPTLAEDENEFLAFIISNSGTPVAAVYKALGVSVALGTKLRESLKALGLVAELEVRTGRASGGRPTKCLIPTFAALELVGKDPPPGRGGVLHRHIQQRVVSGALAKGYSAEAEHKLASGAIVDVHLAKGAGCRIAVEIAIVSKVDQGISHIRSCLAVGYDQIFTLFADEQLRARVAAAIQTALSGDEQRKVRLLPLRQLAHIG